MKNGCLSQSTLCVYVSVRLFTRVLWTLMCMCVHVKLLRVGLLLESFQIQCARCKSFQLSIVPRSQRILIVHRTNIVRFDSKLSRFITSVKLCEAEFAELPHQNVLYIHIYQSVHRDLFVTLRICSFFVLVFISRRRPEPSKKD